MNTVNIFDEGREINESWAKFVTIGDSVQGTYIGKRRAPSSIDGKIQVIYNLLTPNGVVNVAKPETHTGFHYRMDTLKFGQIVGFRFTEEIPSKTKGFNPTKVIVIYADPQTVYKEWLAENPHANERNVALDLPVPPNVTMSEEDPFDDVPFDTTKTTDEIKQKTIGALIMAKFNIADPDKAMEKSMEVSNLPYLPKNFDAIITALRKL
jgi:hypothetical protein